MVKLMGTSGKHGNAEKRVIAIKNCTNLKLSTAIITGKDQLRTIHYHINAPAAEPGNAASAVQRAVTGGGSPTADSTPSFLHNCN